MISDFKSTCLIGSSGLIGENLRQNCEFDYLINSKNLETIKNKEIDFIVCAAPSAVKWKININGDDDLNNVFNITDVISSINYKKLVLCSTVDVYGYETDLGLDENNNPNFENNHNYGKNRIIFENELRKLSGDKLSIIRLSGLFGPFLKKNLLFDIKNNNNDMLSKINFESQLQWYNLKNLKNDILKNLNKKILNLVNEPIKNKEIFEFSSLNLKNNLEITRSVYNIKTYHHNDGFFNKKEEVLKEIDDYLTT
jgi:nucleoside-diphosphate-sugar epimerase